MKIVIGSDHLGYTLKDEIIKHLSFLRIDYLDMGVSSKEEVIDYPDVAYRVTEKIKNQECDRGILICGTGIGMAIAANKVPGIYAATCHDIYSAERARKSNNTNILTLGALVIGVELAKKIVEIWIFSEFGGGQSAIKIEKIRQMEEKVSGKGCCNAIHRY